MSRGKNLSEADLRYNSFRVKNRDSTEHKRGVLQPKINRNSPYSQIPTITKTRSISTFKAKVFNKHSSNSPKLSRKTSNNNSLANIITADHAVNSQRSITESYRQLYKDNPPKINFSYKNSRESLVSNDFSQLEIRLTLASKLIPIEAAKEYNAIFETIIEKDVIYGKLLKKIKDFMDFSQKSHEKSIRDIDGLKKKLLENEKKISTMAEDRKFIERRLHQISQENLDLCKNLEESEANYSEVEEKLIKIANFELQAFPHNEKTWKALVIENKSFSEICRKMREDLKNYRKKEKKLLKLILALKNRGFPVEEVYNEEINTIVLKSEENSESDRIVSGRVREVPKPSTVPLLQISKIEHESFSSSFDSST